MNYKQNIRNLFSQVADSNYNYMQDLLDLSKKAAFTCVFGLGAIGRHVIPLLLKNNDMRIDFLCDNNPELWGTSLFGIICISPDELYSKGENSFTIITTQYHHEISKQLEANGLYNHCLFIEHRHWATKYFNDSHKLLYAESKIIELTGLLTDETSKQQLWDITQSIFCTDAFKNPFVPCVYHDEYFPDTIIRLTEEESFVDIGAYNGDTIIKFLEMTGKKFKSIYAFEMDRDNYMALLEEIKKRDIADDKIEIYNLGAWDKNTEATYIPDDVASKILESNTGETKTAKLMRLDDVLENKRITYVKMDIEGAELNALAGMKNIIQAQKPKLAICIYHTLEHLWEIPLYIHSIMPEYKLHICHHSSSDDDIACYAVL